MFNLCLPGVDQLDPAAVKVCDVASGHGCLLRVGYGGYLTVELADRTTRFTAFVGDDSIGTGGSAVKREDAVTEILVQNAFNRLAERVSSFASGQD